MFKYNQENWGVAKFSQSVDASVPRVVRTKGVNILPTGCNRPADADGTEKKAQSEWRKR